MGSPALFTGDLADRIASSDDGCGRVDALSLSSLWIEGR